MTITEFQSHPILQKAELLLNRIDEQEVKEKLEIDKIDFFKTACQFLIGRLKVTIPTLLSISDLNTISTEFENALVQINNYVGNNNVGHITNAVNNVNSALTYVKNLPIHYSEGDFDFSKNISQFQQTVEDKLNQTEKIRAELTIKFDTLKIDIESKKDELSQFTEIIAAKKLELENISANFQAQFENANTTFTNLVSDDRAKFRLEIDTDREKIRTETDGIIKELERKLHDANKLVNVIGNVGVTGNYQIIANEHKKSADNWRKLATTFMCILSGLLIFSIWKIGDVDYDWHKAIIRIIASAILIYPATYASRESGKHRKLENLNRKLELELSSISPFIEILDEAKKQQIKEKLVEKYFGNNSSIVDDNEKHDYISANMLETISKFVNSITKK